MASNTSRTLLVTLLGAFARRTDNWLPISGIVSLLDALEVEESSVRTGVSRLKKRQWLEPEKRDSRNGYQLTQLARRTLSSGDKFVWHAREPAALDEGWCIASFSVPETERARRHLLRSRLASLGFGNVGAGVWLAPARMHADAMNVIDSLGLAEYTNLFVGQHRGGQDLHEMVRASWDLDDIDARYRTFVAAHTADIDKLETVRGSDIPVDEAFVRYMRALDDWRMLPMRDPGLPRELLPHDWAGDDAAVVLERIVAELDAPAFEFVRANLDVPVGAAAS